MSDELLNNVQYNSVVVLEFQINNISFLCILIKNVNYFQMKNSKTVPVIVETAVGKFLVRDFRPPIRLRTSPRKKKNKLKKDIKRLDENNLTLLTNKKQQKNRKNIDQVKKKLNFQDNNDQDDKNSILFIISNEQQDNQLNEDDLTNSKYKLVQLFLFF